MQGFFLFIDAEGIHVPAAVLKKLKENVASFDVTSYTVTVEQSFPQL